MKVFNQLLVSLVFLLMVSSCDSPSGNDELVEYLMNSQPEKFDFFLKNKDSLEIQIIYTQIDRDESNRPNFNSYYFNVDTSRYFYPASTVKLPMVLLALEKLNELSVHGLNKHTPMFSDSVYAGQSSVLKDTTAENGLPTIAHYAKKILIVSDNDAFNRLYEFVGQKEANRVLQQKGYRLRLLHRLERPLSYEENRHTEAIRFITDDKVIYEQPGLINEDSIIVHKRVFKGKGFIRSGELVNQPFDFTYKNFYSLTDQQDILKAIVFPNAVDSTKRFNISEEDRKFVLKYMSQLPAETKYPPYFKDLLYYDAYCKFLLFGEDRTKIPDHIRIFNKVGDAYGYLLDNAYVVDLKNGVEFMLSVVINTNTDGVYNDGKYEYKKLGFPFMKDLGQLIYNYELKRYKKFKPELTEFKFNYDR